MPKIVAVVPCFNVAETVSDVIIKLCSHVDEVITVNDGSKDNTREILCSLPCIYIEHCINLGQGAALATGTEYALSIGADIIIHFDSDGQHQVKDIERMIQPIISKESDIVLGSRFLKGADKKNIPFSKRAIVLPVSKLINFFFTGLWLTDAHNGFRALSSHAARTIRITQDRMAHASEIIEEISIHKLRFVERPVDILYAEYGQGLLGGLRIIKELLLGKFIK